MPKPYEQKIQSLMLEARNMQHSLNEIAAAENGSQTEHAEGAPVDNVRHSNNCKCERCVKCEQLLGIKLPKKVARRPYNLNNEIERLLLINARHVSLHCDHWDMPHFNVGIWPQDKEKLLTSYPALAFSVPRPIFVSTNMNRQIDRCVKRPMDWENFRTRASVARTTYQKHAKKKLNGNENEGEYHNVVFDFAERINCNPDPYFRGPYDYYYSGGNLCSLPHSNYIVHANDEQLRTLEISQFPPVVHYPNRSMLSTIAKMTTTEECEIFEIKPLLPSSDKSRFNCFIARQRNLISLNCLTENHQLKVVTHFRTKSTPFISFAQSPRDPNKLILTTMKQHLRLYDLNSSVPRLAKLFEIESDGPCPTWNTIKPWRENTFLYANPDRFCFVDIRTMPSQWMTAAIPALAHNVPCDYIRAIAPSEFNNLFYVATNHKLHCMDVRNIRSDSFDNPEAVICRWAHQLQYPPLMIDTFRTGNNELIALSSPVPGDLHVCQLTRQKNEDALPIQISQRVPKHIYRSPCMPYQPPTISEAYACARLAGKCLQPEAEVDKRIAACTTGLSFSKSSDEHGDGLAMLLYSTSLGDIYMNTLTKREGEEQDSRGNSQSNEFMDEFANILANKRMPLSYTKIVNLRALRKVFLCKYLNADLKYDLDAMNDSFSESELQNEAAAPSNQMSTIKRKRKRLHMGRWQKSYASLKSYKDALVPDILSIWDVDVDDDDKHLNLNTIKNDLRLKQDPVVKVQDWLELNVQGDAPMISIPKISTSMRDELQLLNETIEPTTSAAAAAAKSDRAAAAQRSNDTTASEKPAAANNTLNETDMNVTQNSLDFENAVQSTQLMDQTTATMDEANATKTSVSSTKVKSKKKGKKYVKGF